MSHTVFLMYHELETPNRALCHNDAGYVRYVVSQANFRRQLAHLRAKNLRGLNVTQALNAPNSRRSSVAITFDDGSETDWIVAAPLLQEMGFGATFFVVAGWIGREGYLNRTQLRQLSEAGFEIGCHSMNHRYLTELNASKLRVEINDAKQLLEHELGESVAHFSCPGGRWNRNVARAAQEAGFASLSTSRAGANNASTDRFNLAREAVLHRTNNEEFARLCRGGGLWKRQAQAAVLTATKGVLGNDRYEKVRARALERR